MKTIDDALELRGADLRRLRDGGGGARSGAAADVADVRGRRRRADRRRDGGPDRRAVAPRAARQLPADRPAAARVVLLDAGPTVLPAFPPRLQRKAARALERLGVELHLNAPVTGVDATGVDVGVDDPTVRRIDARTKIWAPASGVAAGGDAGRAERRDGRSRRPRRGAAGLHAAGPPRGVRGRRPDEPRPAPGVAEVAIQSGRHAARTISRRLDGDADGRPFRYRDLGTMATISRFGRSPHRPRSSTVGLHRLGDLAGRPPGVPDRVQEPRLHRSPTGRSRFSGAAARSG